MWPPNTVPMVVLSVGLFTVFLKTDVPYSPALNRIASTTFGVYLWHDGPLSDWLWHGVFRCAAYAESSGLILRVLGAAVILFVMGVWVDLIRQEVEKRVLPPFLDSVERRLGPRRP